MVSPASLTGSRLSHFNYSKYNGKTELWQWLCIYSTACDVWSKSQLWPKGCALAPDRTLDQLRRVWLEAAGARGMHGELHCSWVWLKGVDYVWSCSVISMLISR